MAYVEKSCVFCLSFYVGGAELYHNLTAKVKASVRSLIASGPQFHLRIWYTDPVPTRFRPSPNSGRMSAYCATEPDRTKISPVRSGPSPTVRSGQSNAIVVQKKYYDAQHEPIEFG